MALPSLIRAVPRVRRACALALLLTTCLRANAASIDARVATADGQPVADAVIVAVPADRPSPPPRPRAEALDQIDQQFVPRVKAIGVGSSVAFPNRDNVRHHVYSFSPAKRFELPLYAGVPAQPVLFDKPGVVVLGCNIHDWMIGYVYVSESPWFAQTTADGRARLDGLPPGRYTVRVWHPQQVEDEGTTQREVVVQAGPAATAAWTIALRPDVRVRRAPAVGGHGGHY